MKDVVSPGKPVKDMSMAKRLGWTTGGVAAIGVLAICTGLFSSCGFSPEKRIDPQKEAAASGVSEKEKRSPESIRKILVAPFADMTALHGEKQTVFCPFCLSSFTTEKVEDEAADILTQLLVLAVEKRGRHEVMSVDAPPRGDSPGAAIPKKERPHLLALGKAVGADAVLAGHVYRFVERKGTDYSVESPASVLFDIDLVRVADGHTLWSARVDETQKSLMENLFSLGTFMERRGKWVPAAELSRHGMEKAVQGLP